MYEGNMIKNLRIKRGLTQTQLAIKANVTQQHISGIELGNIMPSIKTYNKILSVLGFELYLRNTS